MLSVSASKGFSYSNLKSPSFVGVIFVSLSDSSSKPIQGIDHASRPLLGDCLALLSALCYALYVTLLKVRIRMESRINMLLFFGFVGLFNLLTCWPIGVVLHLTGVEVFELPQTGKAWGAIVLNVSPQI
jgi:solute carrier family 35 protein F5